jgi:HPt (histidine-containing phosphotransfer) domain-containing protein
VTTPEPAAPRAATINQQALDKLRSLQRKGRPDVVSKVIRTYLGHAPLLLDSLRDAVARGDASAIEHAAHSLKSSSSNVGALTLSRLCAELEEMGRCERLTQATSMASTIELEYLAVQEALETEVYSGVS